MTREEALSDLDYAPARAFIEDAQVELTKNVILTINQIYDDFENISCESCRYWKYKDNTALIETCNFGLIEHSYRPEKFSCNRWMEK